MFEALEDLIIKHYKNDFAFRIANYSPLSAIHKDSFEYIKEEIEKYGLSYKIASDDFYYLYHNTKRINYDQIIKDRNKILYDWITNKDKEEFIIEYTHLIAEHVI